VSAGLTQPSEDERWRAIATRDARYDGRFVFGVVSTGVYCQPSCGSKRPRRQNVVFFAGPREAESEGFRACLRCRPADPLDAGQHRRVVREACSYIERNLDKRLTLRTLGEHLNVSPFHLQRVFKRAVGISPREYADKLRVDRARLLLKRGESVRRSTYDSGHNSTSWLYSNPGTVLGMPPAAYGKGGAGVRINYCITDCRLGRLLVAGTERGVCAVSMGDSDARLQSFLRNEYPKAVLDNTPTGLKDWVDRIVRFVDGSEAERLADLPLDVRASSFQYRVWKELRSVPYGATVSYGDIARRIGSPTASRAVANACASNPVALVVPCHRVIRSDGEPGGYRWGRERKEALLEKEAENVRTS